MPASCFHFKVAAEAPDGRVWTFANSGGTVNVLSREDLSVEQRWRLPGESYQTEAPGRPTSGEPPVPQAVGALPGRDLVWLLMAVADEEWSPEINPARDGASRYFDTAVLAIDPKAPAIIASGKIDALCTAITDSRISCVDEAEEQIRILRLDLRRRSGD